jgi:hypothetical protein
MAHKDWGQANVKNIFIYLYTFYDHSAFTIEHIMCCYNIQLDKHIHHQ